MSQATLQNNQIRPASNNRPPILLFSSVLITVLAVLWLTASLCDRVALEASQADATNSISSGAGTGALQQRTAHSMSNGQLTSAICAMSGTASRNCQKMGMVGTKSFF